MKPRRQHQRDPISDHDASMADFFAPEKGIDAPVPHDIAQLLAHLPITVPRHHTRILRLLDRQVHANRLCSALIGDRTTFWDVTAPTPANVLPDAAETAVFLLDRIDATPRSLDLLLHDQADRCLRCRGPRELEPVMTSVLRTMADHGVIRATRTTRHDGVQAGDTVLWTRIVRVAAAARDHRTPPEARCQGDLMVP